jgi:ligand-binding sensor domain-containing protein
MFGISYRVTNSICEDENGFIWASSKTGILRLTDNDYRIYQLPYETAGAIVVKLIYDHSRLIAYTNNGQIFAYNQVFDRFDLLIDLGKTINDEKFDFYNLLIDQVGDFWLALNNGLYKYHSGKLTLIDEVSREKYSIAWLDEQHLIVANPEGLWSMDINSLEKKSLYENRSINPFLISSLFLDKSQNKLWIGTFSSGLFCFNFNSSILSQVLQSSFPRQPILDIEENSDSTILVGIDGQGVWEVNKQDHQVKNVYKEIADDPYSLRGNGVYDIYYDHHKRVWICTISGGLSFYELASPIVNQVVHHANDVNSLVNSDVNGIIEDRDGRIWFATNNGISSWDYNTPQY